MALDESAVSALLDALDVGEGTDLVRQLAQWALQQLIDAPPRFEDPGKERALTQLR